MIGLAILVGLAFAKPAMAQASGSDYKLMPEDVIHIQVYRTNASQDQIVAEVPVDRFGNVSAPFAGIVKVQGLTTTEVETELAKRYVEKLRLRDPIVSVTIVRYRRMMVSVGGQVNRPGQYEARPGDTILDLINLGGGPAIDRADYKRATLQRGKSREVIPLDLYALLVQGDTSQNFVLEDGDILTVPRSRNTIVVLGAVMQPGTFQYEEPMHLSDAIALAHGEIRYRSRFSRTLILREKPGLPGQYYRIVANFVRFVKQNDQSQNIELQPGDFVYVPETDTPDLQQISGMINTAWIINSVTTNGILGIKF